MVSIEKVSRGAVNPNMSRRMDAMLILLKRGDWRRILLGTLRAPIHEGIFFAKNSTDQKVCRGMWNFTQKY